MLMLEEYPEVTLDNGFTVNSNHRFYGTGEMFDIYFFYGERDGRYVSIPYAHDDYTHAEAMSAFVDTIVKIGKE